MTGNFESPGMMKDRRRKKEGNLPREGWSKWLTGVGTDREWRETVTGGRRVVERYESTYLLVRLKEEGSGSCTNGRRAALNLEVTGVELV